MSYFFLKWLHIVGTTVLLGTGVGFAYFLVRAHRTRDPRAIASVAADVVKAELWFTATAVLLQPVTGLLMMMKSGWSLAQPWLGASIIIYVVVGCCWVPVVWLQKRMRDVAQAAAEQALPLPASYLRYFRWWIALGGSGFAGVLLIAWLMVSKQRI